MKDKREYDVIINGRVLGKPLNGIPRFAFEIINSIDCLNPKDLKIGVAVPPNVSLKFKNLDLIKLKTCWNWDFWQAELFAKKKKAIYVNLANKGAFYRNSLSVIYDIRVLRLPKTEKAITRLKFWLSFAVAVRHCKKIVTISNFCKTEIESVSKRRDIEVMFAGWDHLTRTQTDESIFRDFPELRKKEYVLSIGSVAPHKRFDLVGEFAKKYPEVTFAIAGSFNKKLWSTTIPECPNLVFLGFQSDQRLKALLENAGLFLFPSVYEGFGIPPLEALSCSIPCLVSDIPVMRELFGECVHYIDEANLLLPDFEKKPLSSKKDDILNMYQWSKSGSKLIEILKAMKNE